MSREDRLPNPVFGQIPKHTSTDTAFFYWSWRVFEIKPHPPFFLSMKVQKNAIFHSVEISVSCWKAAVTFKLNGCVYSD